MIMLSAKSYDFAWKLVRESLCLLGCAAILAVGSLLAFPYNEPLPEALIRKIARHRVRTVRDREDDGFW